MGSDYGLGLEAGGGRDLRWIDYLLTPTLACRVWVAILRAVIVWTSLTQSCQNTGDDLDPLCSGPPPYRLLPWHL